MIKDILLHPYDDLRTPADPIEDWEDEKWSYLVDDLGDTFDSYEGGLVGLAANQIGHPYRALMVGIEEHRLYMFNPVIRMKSTIKLGHMEGCGSLPGIEVWVPRPTTIMVSYDDPILRKSRVRRFEQYWARIIQHEIDHLNGILITDYNQENHD